MTPVGLADDVEVVLDDEHARASLGERVQRLDHRARVLGVETGAGLVEHEQGAFGGLAERACQLQALRFATRQHGERLPERQVSEPHLDQRLERALQHVVALLERIEELERFLDGEREHLGDVDSLVLHRQHLGLEALASAGGTQERDVGEELHLHRLVALAGARLAATGGDVEREVRRRQRATDRLRLRGEARAHPVPRLGVGGRVAARGASERRLIDQRDAPDLVATFDLERIVRPRPRDAGVTELTSERAVDDLLGQRRLAGSGRTGDGADDAERDVGRRPRAGCWRGLRG